MLIANDHSEISKKLCDHQSYSVKLFKLLFDEPKFRQYLNAQNFQMVFTFIETFSSYYTNLYAYMQCLLEECNIDYLSRLNFIPEDFFANRSFDVLNLDKNQALQPCCFAGCRVNELYLSKATTVIQKNTFKYAYVRNIYIPDSVVKIEKCGFSNIETTGDVNIHIPASVKEIDIEAFIYNEHSGKYTGQTMNVIYDGSIDEWHKAVEKSINRLNLQSLQEVDIKQYNIAISNINNTEFRLQCKS